MEKIQIKILQFLSTQQEPVSVKNFPDEIKDEFQKFSVKPGSLIHELAIVLTQNKRVLKNDFGHSYSLSEVGKKWINDNTEI